MLIEKIGIVILNYKTWEKTILCVQSIIDTYKSPKTIVIVDNNSPNNSYENLVNYYKEEKYDEITVIKTSKNGGFSYGNNFGFNYIRKNHENIKHVIMTNNDIIFQEQTLTKLLNNFSINPNIALTAPSILDTNLLKTNNPWSKKPGLLHVLNIRNTDPLVYNWQELTGPTIVYMVSGCCFAVDADKFEQIGEFDENVFLYNEENILSLKLSQAGYQLIADPSANVIHDHGFTTGNSSIFVDKEFVKSSLYFWREYEKLNKISIFTLWLYLTFKMIIKSLIKKYNTNNGLWCAIKETFSYLKTIK